MTSGSFSSRATMLVVVTTLGASVAVADDSEAFLGRWAENVEWCGTTVDNYTVIDEREINITDDRIDLYVSSCEIHDVERTGSTLRVSSTCREEGQEVLSSDVISITPVGDGLHIAAGGADWNVVRCP